jgi:uncharacterized protein YjcR
MTELETKLIDLLRVSEAESKERERRILERMDSLQQQVSSSAQQVEELAKQQDVLIDRYNKVAALLNEELER